jgi:hypothetical protein
MYYTIYKTTNLINNKIYIGQHITDNLDDGYLGSGTNLHKAIKKYGKENFKKEILHIFDNFDDMDNKEKELVTKEFVLREDTYNLIQGGLQFNTTGQTIVKDKDGNNQLVYLNDPRYLSGELVGVTKGKVVVKDKDGNAMSVSINDSRYLSGELIPIAAGKVTVKDKDGNILYVSTDDPRYLSGELISIVTGKALVKDKDGNMFSVFIDFHNIHVVFTKTAETADHYIEKFAHENGKKYNVTVATSDGVEQVIIRGQGCLLISAREFEKEIAAMEEHLRENYLNKTY